MNDQIAPIKNDNELVKYDPKDLASVMSNSDWLPRFQVMGASTTPVKAGKCTMGVLALVNGESIDELGKECDVMVITVRPKALRITPDGTPLSYFDRNKDTFKRTAAEALVKDSGCMFGPEYLIWVPSRSVFATMFCGSKTLRRVGPDVLKIIKPTPESPYAPGMATIKSVFIEPKGSKYSWHGFVCVKCSTPASTIPDPEDQSVEVEKFNNPVDSVIEVAAPAEQSGRAR